ncbi:PHD finger protein 3, partial [Frankliniella fusca]
MGNRKRNKSKEPYCICKSMKGNGFMVACDSCDKWFHGNCVGVTQNQIDEEYKDCEWFCFKCSWKEKETEFQNLLESRTEQISVITSIHNQLQDTVVANFQAQEKLLLTMLNKFKNLLEGVDLHVEESETKYRTLYEAMQRLKNQAQSNSKEQDYETLQRKAKDLETQKQQLNTEWETKYRTLNDEMHRLKNQVSSNSIDHQDYKTLQRKAMDLETENQQLKTEWETKYRTLEAEIQRLKNQVPNNGIDQADYETLKRKSEDLEAHNRELKT